MKRRAIAAVLAGIALALLAWLLFASPPTVPAQPAADSTPEAAAIPPPIVAASSATATERTQRAAAAESSASGELHGSLLVHVLWSDGTPAAGIHVYLAQREPGLTTPIATGQSDADGNAGFDRLPAGKLGITTDRPAGKETTVEITPGRQQETELRLDAGLAVDGTVRDSRGRAVADAAIWLSSRQTPWMAGAIVAHSGAGGAFHLRGVPPSQSLGALAPGFAPSELVDLDLLDKSSPPVKVELVVRTKGGTIEGRVVDPRGEGVAGALVAIGNPARLLQSRTSGTFAEQWSPRTVRTDAGGRFAMDSLQPGRHHVEVWARHFPYWRGGCEIAAGAVAQIEVTLTAGVTVTGTIRGEDDKPLAGAVVRAFPIAINEQFLQGGQYDYDSTFGCPRAVADAAGTYRLERAAPGKLHLYAGGPLPERRRTSTVVPWASAVLDAAPGESLVWNAKVEPGPTIAGVVRYRDGLPMPGLFVTATESDTKQRHVIVTDQDGRFRIIHLEAKAHDVSVQFWSAPKDTPPLGAHDVWPDRGTLELVASFDAPKKLVNGAVRGRVDDAGGRLGKAALAVILEHDDRSWSTNAKIDGGAFAFTGVAPGRHRVVVMNVEDPVVASDWFELQQAEDRQLDPLVTPPGGSLLLRVVRAAGAESAEPTAWLQPAQLNHARKVELGRRDELVVENLTAGEYHITARSRDFVAADCSARVAAGETAEATLHFAPAALREFVVDYPADQQLKRVELRRDDGTVLTGFDIAQAAERPFRIRWSVPVGRFVFHAATSAAKGAVPFEMTTLAADQPAVRLELR